jgi:hypothetical protein
MTIELFLSIAVLAVGALIWGAVYIMRKGGDRKRGVLMLIAALVLLGNVLIIAWP